MASNLNPRPAKEARTKAWCAFNLASFTIGAEAANVINVAVQLKDAKNQAVAQVAGVKCYLSDAATGIGLTATALTSAPTIGTNGTLLDITTTGKVFSVVTDASGRFDINLPQTATPSYYLVIVCPDGSILVSSIITFA